MIEISLTELVLLGWAVLATASWLHARDDARMSKHVLRLLLDDPEAREQIIKAHEEFMRKQGEA